MSYILRVPYSSSHVHAVTYGGEVQTNQPLLARLLRFEIQGVALVA
jgi:hypothetical protein